MNGTSMGLKSPTKVGLKKMFDPTDELVNEKNLKNGAKSALQDYTQ